MSKKITIESLVNNEKKKIASVSLQEKIQLLKSEGNYRSLADLAYECYLKEDIVNLRTCVNILIDAYSNKKDVPYVLMCYLAGELTLAQKSFDAAKLNFYLAIKSKENANIELKKKAVVRLRNVCERTGDIRTVDCFYCGLNEQNHQFIVNNTEETISLKITPDFMKGVSVNDLVRLTIFEINDKYRFVYSLRILEKAMEIDKTIISNVSVENAEEKLLKEIRPVALKKLYAYEGDLPYIFVSYSHKDSEVVLPIIEGLQNIGFRVWFDQGIEVGSEWPRYIGEHLAACDSVIVCLSPNAEDSINCRSEINMAVKRKKNIIVLYLEDFEVQDLGLELLISILQAIRKSRHASLRGLLNELYNAKLLQNCKE